jgi:hypothetical protein
MKTIVAFVLGATLVGVTSGVIASDVDTYNHMNGYWGTSCPTTYGVDKPCDETVLTYMEENMLYN